MTNHEIINFLNQVRKILLGEIVVRVNHSINEAFDITIKALQQSEPCNDDKGCSNCMYSGRPTYKSPYSECRDRSQWEMKPISRSHENGTKCEDTISRQAAIDVVCAVCGNDCDKSKFVYNAPQDDQIIMCPEHYGLTQLPSAQHEIIHCRECKYAHLTYGGDCKYCDKWLDDDGFNLTLYLDGDFYCGFAEMKEDE